MPWLFDIYSKCVYLIYNRMGIERKITEPYLKDEDDDDTLEYVQKLENEVVEKDKEIKVIKNKMEKSQKYVLFYISIRDIILI